MGNERCAQIHSAVSTPKTTAADIRTERFRRVALLASLAEYDGVITTQLEGQCSQSNEQQHGGIVRRERRICQ